MNDNFINEMNKKDERIMLGGINFKVAMKKNSQTLKTYYAKSPTHDTYPILFNLIEKLLQVYREKNPDSFLKKENTFFY